MQTFRLASFVLALAGLASVSASPSHAHEGRHNVVARQSSSSSSSSSSSAVEPLTPATTNEGRPLAIQWTTTTNPDWQSMEIKLMTGSNQNMTELATIATGVDGTTSGAGRLSWTAPAVTPNSGIYFFQFSHDGEELTWTTRFAIADADGQTTTPPEANQPEGGSPAIPWGLGALEGGTASASAASSSSTSSSASATSSSASSTTPAFAATATRLSTASSSTAPAPSSTSSGIDLSKYNSGNQPSSAPPGSDLASAVVMVGAAVVGAAAILL